jgi:hypothetical protein
MNPTVSEAVVFTATLTSVFIVPAGARTIDLNNKGGSTAKYKGSSAQLGGVTIGFVDLKSLEAYSFGDLNKPYPAITIDPSGSEVDITVTY